MRRFYSCVSCGGKLSAENNFLSPTLGGLVDEPCRQEALLGKAVSESAIKALRFFQANPLSMSIKLGANKKVQEELREILNFYSIFFLEKNLNSLEFASQVDKALSVN